MKIQIYILLQNLKKSWLWIIILMFLMILSLIFYSVRPVGLEVSSNDFIALLGIPLQKQYSFFALLISIYQMGFTVYFVFIYYSYELDFSFENIILRVNEKKWIFEKIFVCIVFTIIMRLTYTGLTYIYFHNKILFEASFIILPVIYHILISMILITIINFIKLDNSLKFFITIILSFLVFIKFITCIATMLIIILICLNIIHFYFKKYYI